MVASCVLLAASLRARRRAGRVLSANSSALSTPTRLAATIWSTRTSVRGDKSAPLTRTVWHRRAHARDAQGMAELAKPVNHAAALIPLSSLVHDSTSDGRFKGPDQHRVGDTLRSRQHTERGGQALGLEEVGVPPKGRTGPQIDWFALSGWIREQRQREHVEQGRQPRW